MIPKHKALANIKSGRFRWRASVTGGVVLLGGIAAVVGWWPPLFDRPRSVMADETAIQPAPIDGNRAYGYLKQICDLGPRPAGSEANTKQRQMVASHFEAQGGRVFEQKFRGVDPRSGRRVELANLIASWHPERDERILICAHYDTRPHADEEFDPNRFRQPFLGANDGASGVALLMEIANHLNDFPTEWGVDLILLDAEELVYGRGGQTAGQYFLGSKAFAGAYARARREKKITYRYHAGILLDMVAGRNLSIEREPYSVRYVPWLVDEVWSVAERLGANAFVRTLGTEVFDDHIELNRGGIPTIDIIDFDYPHWHLITDTPEQCAPESLALVGRVVTGWLSLPKSESDAAAAR